jgi:hypothetical protein
VGSLRWAEGGTTVSHESETDARPARPEPRQRRRTRVEGGRKVRHEVKVTPEEEGRLLRLALQYGVSVPKLLVDSALAGGSQAAATNASVREHTLAEMFKTQRVLSGVANNVNQIARAANIDGAVREELSATLVTVRRASDKIAEYIDQLGAAR